VPPQFRHVLTEKHRRRWTTCWNSIQEGAGLERRGCANLRTLQFCRMFNLNRSRDGTGYCRSRLTKAPIGAFLFGATPAETKAVRRDQDANLRLELSGKSDSRVGFEGGAPAGSQANFADCEHFCRSERSRANRLNPSMMSNRSIDALLQVGNFPSCFKSCTCARNLHMRSFRSESACAILSVGENSRGLVNVKGDVATGLAGAQHVVDAGSARSI
jgi:hypothetical protein